MTGTQAGYQPWNPASLTWCNAFFLDVNSSSYLLLSQYHFFCLFFPHTYIFICMCVFPHVTLKNFIFQIWATLLFSTNTPLLFTEFTPQSLYSSDPRFHYLNNFWQSLKLPWSLVIIFIIKLVLWHSHTCIQQYSDYSTPLLPCLSSTSINPISFPQVTFHIFYVSLFCFESLLTSKSFNRGPLWLWVWNSPVEPGMLTSIYLTGGRDSPFPNIPKW